MPHNPWNQSRQTENYENANLLTNVTILALTVGIYYFSSRSVRLSAENVRLATLNAMNNKESAQTEKQTLEVLKEINNKISKE